MVVPVVVCKEGIELSQGKRNIYQREPNFWKRCLWTEKWQYSRTSVATCFLKMWKKIKRNGLTRSMQVMHNERVNQKMSTQG